MNCEHCTSPMQYTTTEEFCRFGVVDVDYWLCLFCGNETITVDQIKINDARVLQQRAFNIDSERRCEDSPGGD